MGAECLTADPQLYHKAPGMGKIKSYLYLPFPSEDSEGQKDDECVGRRMRSGVPSPGSSLASPSGEEGKGLLTPPHQRGHHSRDWLHHSTEAEFNITAV